MRSFRFHAISFLVLITMGLLAAKPALAIQVWQNRRYVYFSIPANQLVMKDRVEALKLSTDFFLDAISKYIPSNRLTEVTVRQLKNKSNKELKQIVEDMNAMAQDERPGFFRAGNLIPSGFMILVGGKVTANWVIGGGGSGTFALVVVPTKLVIIDKITKKLRVSYTFRMAVSFIPAIDIGGGVGGGARARIGIGLIWGTMDDPREFKGLSASASGTVALFGGLNVKLGTIIGLGGVKLIYATGMFEFGAVATGEIHGNVGYVFNLTNFMKSSVVDSFADTSIVDYALDSIRPK